MVAIEVKSVTKKYRKNGTWRTILQNITLSIDKGTITAITGTSGCGKSTLLSIMGLLQPPDAGEIIIDTIRCSKLSPTAQSRIRRERFGFVFQDFGLLSNYSMFDNIRLPLVYEGLPQKEIDRQTQKVMELFGIAHLVKQYPHECSGGEQQRCALARALVRAPDIIFADEPTGNLDAENARFVFDCFTTLAHDTGATIIVVTHDTALATQTDQVIVL